MPKTKETIDAVTEWCGRRPKNLDDPLRMLWEETHPDVPFENEGAERLVRILKKVFSDREINLRPVDILEFTVLTLIDAIPDAAPLAVSMAMAATAPAGIQLAGTAVVSLSDDSIERLARRIAQLLAAAWVDQASKANRPKPRPSGARAQKAAKSTRKARKKTPR